MDDLTYMDCWHYIAPLIPVSSETSQKIYVMVFQAMKEAEQLQRIWREVEALSESVRDGYVSAPDLIRVLREEYEIDIIGG